MPRCILCAVLRSSFTLKMAVFWVVASCSLLAAFIISAPMMAAVSTSETSVNVYQTTRCNNTEDSHLHTRRRENLKSHIFHIMRPLYEVHEVMARWRGHYVLSVRPNVYIWNHLKDVV
jgi:hypothetical protein